MKGDSFYIKSVATSLGFDYCGIARAVKLDDDARRLESWLATGMHGSMQYMEKYFDLRIDPTRLVPGAKSVITLLMNYFPEQHQPESAPKLSRYAYGKDYHEVIREKLNALIKTVSDNTGTISVRGFVDSAPVLERSWATRSGLGWIGKNGNLINKGAGSYFFIATLITDLELDYDDPFARDYCGSCTRCIDACPTNAILPGKTVNGSQCISYFTIELKDQPIPAEFEGKFNDWFFGCDICQEVCPWNRFARPHQHAEFEPLPQVLYFTTSDWESMTEESFNEIFRHSPLKRSKFKGIQRNLVHLKKSSGRG
jgi:epoxyqueuosine reductase